MCSTVLFSTLQCSTVQCSTVQCSTEWCSTVRWSTVQCRTVQCGRVQWWYTFETIFTSLHASSATCHVSRVTYHMSCVTCHIILNIFFGTEWWSSLVEGLLSTRPTHRLGKNIFCELWNFRKTDLAEKTRKYIYFKDNWSNISKLIHDKLKIARKLRKSNI